MASVKNSSSKYSFQYQDPEFMRRQSLVQGLLESDRQSQKQNKANSDLLRQEYRKDKRHLDAEMDNIEGLLRQDSRHTKADLDHLKGLYREDQHHRKALISRFKTSKEK